MKRRILGGAAGLVLVAFSLPIAATADEVPCDTPAKDAVYKTVTHPAVPPVYEIVTVKEAETRQVLVTPAVTVAEHKFVFFNKNGQEHPNSPRWEREGWNADDQDSHGWQSTGDTQLIELEPAVYTTVTIPAVTERRLVTPGKDAWEEKVLVSPAVPAGPPCDKPEPPKEQPPIVTPPVVDPPVEEPPVVTPPVVEPPVVEPPVEEPPVTEPPVEEEPEPKPDDKEPKPDEDDDKPKGWPENRGEVGPAAEVLPNTGAPALAGLAGLGAAMIAAGGALVRRR